MGLVARVVEEFGIATVNVSTGRDLTAQVRPPRALFVNHPMGNPFGRPGQDELQRDILRAALGLLETTEEAGDLVDSPHEWGEKGSQSLLLEQLSRTRSPIFSTPHDTSMAPRSADDPRSALPVFGLAAPWLTRADRSCRVGGGCASRTRTAAVPTVAARAGSA